ncbi:DciA family protein [Streptomyces sp. NPDC086182]|uniref:DciA family protein n=1 Tax=Streptomyces sp. NPDC086182 TaxID=3155058 RepID=UPI00343F41EF
MTETNPTEHPPASDVPELSGVDLARVTLRQARQTARKNGGEVRAPHNRSQTVLRRDRREPSGFAAVLQGLMADRAWELPAAGGTVLDRWSDIAAAVSPHLPEHVQAVAFNPETGQLDLRPDSPAYATQLRLISARIVAAANQAAGTDAVRTVRVLPTGAAPEPHTTQPAPAASTVTGAPVKTRESASTGFHQTLAAHQAARPKRHSNADIAQAVERQTRAMHELSTRAFPEPETVDDAPASIDTMRVLLRQHSSPPAQRHHHRHLLHRRNRRLHLRHHRRHPNPPQRHRHPVTDLDRHRRPRHPHREDG